LRRAEVHGKKTNVGGGGELNSISGPKRGLLSPDGPIGTKKHNKDQTQHPTGPTPKKTP